MEHSKLPWKVFNLINIYPDDDDKKGSRHIADCSPDGYEDEAAGSVLTCKEMQANTEFIVKAVNNHQKLVGLANEYQAVLLLLNAINPTEGHRSTDCECLRCQG